MVTLLPETLLYVIMCVATQTVRLYTMICSELGPVDYNYFAASYISVWKKPKDAEMSYKKYLPQLQYLKGLCSPLYL